MRALGSGRPLQAIHGELDIIRDYNKIMNAPSEATKRGFSDIV